MIFLFDLENVHNKGMYGVEYLTEEDTVVLFFSKSAPYLDTYYLNTMAAHSKKMTAIRLITVRSNALDFYIASHVGELVGSGYEGEIAIISGDSGFRSVQEYFGKCSISRRKIILADNVASAISQSQDKGQHRKDLVLGKASTDIMEFMNVYNMSRSPQGRILAALKAENLGNLGGDILKDYKELKPVELYRKLSHEHGKKKGIHIYRLIKNAAKDPRDDSLDMVKNEKNQMLLNSKTEKGSSEKIETGN